MAAQEGLLGKGDSDLLGNRGVGKQHELEKQSARCQPLRRQPYLFH